MSEKLPCFLPGLPISHELPADLLQLQKSLLLNIIVPQFVGYESFLPLLKSSRDNPPKCLDRFHSQPVPFMALYQIY